MGTYVTKIHIIYDHETCIGSFDCVEADPRHFAKNEEAEKAVLLGWEGDAAEELRTIDVDVDEAGLEKLMAAAASCPVSAIHLKNLDTGRPLF